MNMGFYTTTRIITATKSQLDAMCYAQEDFVNILDNKTTQDSIIRNTFASYGGAVIPLVFAVSTVASVALGVISLIGSLNAAELLQGITDAKEGHRQLLKSYRTMVNFNAIQVNMTLTVNKERPGSELAYIKAVNVNWIMLPDGTKLM